MYEKFNIFFHFTNRQNFPVYLIFLKARLDLGMHFSGLDPTAKADKNIKCNVKENIPGQHR